MVYAAWFVFGFAFLRLMVSLWNLTRGSILRFSATQQDSLVSVLIPARNEAGNLPVLLEHLSRQSYPNLEILIYDDDSSDETWELIERHAARDKRIRGIRGRVLPQGWLGKNHACHKLALEARGTLLLFMDADIRPAPAAIASAIAFMEKHEVELLSIFPTQQMNSVGEKLTVPLMNWILLSLLPLELVRKSRRPSFAAANGQFMLFRAGAYHVHQWHEKVKAEAAEDIAICRQVKRSAGKAAVLTGGSLISCRMYASLAGGIRGFSKNARQFMGGSAPLLLFFTLVVLSGPFLLFFALDNLPFLAGIVMFILIRVFTSLPSRQDIITNLLLHPFQMLAWAVIAFTAVYREHSGNLQWKGRNIILEKKNKA
ncbi:MAG TPA: glycosyltransferase [Bacteroidales bacterium]|nr:glycosyltransferase [Bacteroidales bacterium]HSA44159.1 glycosyltransferase [Bacteroidales bacterium]